MEFLGVSIEEWKLRAKDKPFLVKEDSGDFIKVEDRGLNKGIEISGLSASDLIKVLIKKGLISEADL